MSNTRHWWFRCHIHDFLAFQHKCETAACRSPLDGLTTMFNHNHNVSLPTPLLCSTAVCSRFPTLAEHFPPWSTLSYCNVFQLGPVSAWMSSQCRGIPRFLPLTPNSLPDTGLTAKSLPRYLSEPVCNLGPHSRTMEISYLPIGTFRDWFSVEPASNTDSGMIKFP